MAVPARRPDDPVPGIGPLPPDPRKIVEARAGDLFIDRNAQRDLDGERVAQIAQEFDWRRFEMPTCSRLSDGRLRVVEGQHRVSAVVLRDPNTILRVLELDEGLTLAEEAGLGLAITAKRRIHSAYAKWELRVRRGDAHEIAAQEVLRAHGLRLGTKTSPTAIACVSVVDHLIHANRQTPEMGAETLDTALRVIEIAYPRDEPDSAATRWNRDLLKAVSALVLRNPTLDVSRLAGALRDRIAQQWITQAKAIDAPAWAVIAQSLADRYNKGLRNQSRRIGLE